MQLLECNRAINADHNTPVAPTYQHSPGFMCWGLRGSRPMRRLVVLPRQTFPLSNFSSTSRVQFYKMWFWYFSKCIPKFPHRLSDNICSQWKGTWPKGVKVVVEFGKLCPEVPSNFLFCSGTSPDDGQCRTGCDGTGCQCSSALPIHTQVI